MRTDRVWTQALAKAGSLSIRTKIMGIVLAIILMLGGEMTWVVRAGMYESLTTELEEQGVSIARDVSARATDLILTNNSYALYELLRDTLENNRDVRYIFVLDQNRMPLVHTFGSAVPQDLIAANSVNLGERSHLEVLETEEGLIRDLAVPVFEGRAGTVRVGMSDRGLRQAISLATERLLLATAISSVAGFFAAYLLASVLSKPISDLLEATKAVARGDLGRKARIHTRDEIGQLGEAFNTMTTGLERSRQEIDVFNRQLLRRNEELSAVNSVATAISRSRDLNEVLPGGLAEALEVMRLRAGWVFLVGKDNSLPALAAHVGISPAFIEAEKDNDLTDCMCGEVLLTGRTVILKDLPESCPHLRRATIHGEGLFCHASVPLTSKGKVLGVMVVASHEDRKFTPEELDLLHTIGNQIGVAIENSRLWKELSEKEELRSQLLVKVMAVQEEERKRIARELHDETSQCLTSLIVGLKVLEKQGGLAGMSEISSTAAELRTVTSKTLEAVHDLAIELRPSALDDLGLVAAVQRYVRDYARRHGCEVDLQVTALDGVRLPPQTELAIYRIIQEALTNTAKYADAGSISVNIERRDRTVVAIVEDDGKGFDVAGLLQSRTAERKLGLFGMQERASLIGGRLTVESAPGAGTTVYVEAPLNGSSIL